MNEKKEKLRKNFLEVVENIKKNFPEDKDIIRVIEEGLKKGNVEDLILLLSPYFDSPKRISLDYKNIQQLFKEGREKSLLVMADKVGKKREIYRQLEKIISN